MTRCSPRPSLPEDDQLGLSLSRFQGRKESVWGAGQQEFQAGRCEAHRVLDDRSSGFVLSWQSPYQQLWVQGRGFNFPEVTRAREHQVREASEEQARLVAGV